MVRRRIHTISLRLRGIDALRVEQQRLTEAWCRQLNLLADARGYFARLRDAPPSDWAAQERATALQHMRHHEVTAGAFHTLLQGVERDLQRLESHAESMKTARRLLSKREPFVYKTYYQRRG
jgi:hypothetical protein